ncbi:AGE family epimerase/isomerase [Massilia yuzhufengensis]|uniref:Mannose or cellobiose epimerase, N-acyl-D-glucosamine 2-epimerase family n=1 Tax=Massilia yuzhufengensis TaxID=1164594 RepID=A0A1I1PY83_9BURK|nr:AGE family epimerase/isomerase [Massilia yuzhufengensis]SFD14715.1 Mannose or cellobiose epimerase, N-acyl-D-glucosamine 2-epimerase family [Massilia yuzhufengensis]
MDTPDFFSPDVLSRHVAHTMAFYHPRCVDPSGGFFHYFRDDGSVVDRRARHLVSSTRFVFVFANAWRHFGDPDYQQLVRHGLDFLRRAHRNPESGGYAWQLEWDGGAARITDADNHCYGLAFVLLAYSHALMAGVEEARAWIFETFDLMEQRFWEQEHGLYADQASADWRVLDPYRGQNANMHACEALLAAFRATGHLPFLHRAETLARNIVQRQAGRAGGMVWEHYTQDWQVDWDFNLHDKANLFRPWGYQPGHFTEWSKLLLQLEAQGPQLAENRDWLLPAAQDLYAKALRYAWDQKHGGLHYGFAPDGTVCDADKYFWVQAETLAAAALLGARTGAERYWVDYERLWRYCWEHFVDHKHGAWYRILTADNRSYSDEKSPAGKVDYHTMGACYDILPALAQRRSPVST